mgnify:CR=1 FL=1
MIEADGDDAESISLAADSIVLTHVARGRDGFASGGNCP